MSKVTLVIYETTSHIGPKVGKKPMFFCNTSLISRIFLVPGKKSYNYLFTFHKYVLTSRKKNRQFIF